MSKTLAQSGAQEGLAVPRTLSSTPTHSSDEGHSPNRTLTDLHEQDQAGKTGLPAGSTLGKVEDDRINKGETHAVHASEGAQALSSLPAGRKSILLFVFCLA